jgi:hypothetical protein
LVTIFSAVKWGALFEFHTYRPDFERGEQTHVQFDMKLSILPLLLGLALMVGCAGEFQSTGSTSSATDDSADRSFQDTIDRLNQQAALDAANAAAQQQNNAAMAAAQETENQHNAEWLQNGLH